MAIKSTIGQMRSHAKFERNEPSTLGAGKKDNYVEFLTTWGRLIDGDSKRNLQFGEALLDNQSEFICRFQTDMENSIDKSCRVIIDNRVFTVASFKLIDQKKYFYRFILNESA